MKSIFSQFSKLSLFNHVMRLAIVVVCLSYSAAATAWTATYQATFTPASGATGTGTVYITGTGSQANTNSSAVTITPTTTSDNVCSLSDTKQSSTQSHNFGQVKFTANAAAGSTFAGWYNSDESELSLNNPYTFPTAKSVSKSVKTLSENYRVKFITRSYNFTPPIVTAAVLVDGDGYDPVDDTDVTNQVGGMVARVIRGSEGHRPADNSPDWHAAITDATIVPEQGNGVDPNASLNFALFAKPFDNYAFLGWYEMDASGNMSELGVTNTYYGFAPTSNVEDATLQTALAGTILVAVFEESLTYYYTNPSVFVSSNEPDGGKVYVDQNVHGTISDIAENLWQKQIIGASSLNTSINEHNISYTYYAIPSDPEKYAFKGWSVSEYSEASYGLGDQDYNHTYPLQKENATDQNPYQIPYMYAVFESFYYKAPPAAVATASKGAGKVFVSLDNVETPSNYYDEVLASNDLQQVAAHEAQYKYSVHYYAQPNDGATFAGWSTTADGLNIVSDDAHYVSTENYTQSKNRDYPHVAAPLYAVFRHDIDIRQQDRMIVYVDDEGNGNINDAKILVDFQKADELIATLGENLDEEFFTISNRSGSKKGNRITFDATQGLIESVLAYKSDENTNLRDAIGKKAEVKFSATYTGGTSVSRSVIITVEEAPVITFLPTDGKGEYSISITNGSGINYTVSKDTKENTKVAITHESMSNIEMNLTSDVADDYTFFGWQMIDDEVKSYLSTNQLCTYQFTKPVKVRPEFIPTEWALFYIKDDPAQTIYYDLQQALNDAQKLYLTTGVDKEVVMKDYRGTSRINEAILRKGNYTVHPHITLLIPGDKSHTHKEILTTSDYDSGKKESNPYIKLIVEDGTNIMVQGNLSLYARLNANGQTWVGRPWQYSWIELGENCAISVESGAGLFAYGYITGASTSSIIVKNGGKVKEAFQMMDWHGGSETINYLNANALWGGSIAASQKVFPVSQYYVQNVEIPMTFEYGAIESLTAGVAMGDLTVVEAPFIDLNSGLFRLVEGMSVTKYYNQYLDRQVYVIRGNGSAVSKLGEITLKNVPLNLGPINLGNQDISSKEFVLPIPHNMDVRLENANVTVLYDLAFLAGSKLTIDKSSVLKIDGSNKPNVYIYDRIQNGAWFGIENKEVLPVGYRPDGMLITRTADMLEDATFVIDGLLETTNNGFLYTTNNTDNHANITSNGGGKVKIAQIGTNGTTYQRKMGEWVSVPVVSARLHNETTTNGLYVSPTAGETYTYVAKEWTKGNQNLDPTISATIDYTPKFIVSNQTFSAYVGKTHSIAITPNYDNINVEWMSVDWDFDLRGEDANQFYLDEDNSSIVFAPTSEGTKMATLRITANYTKQQTLGEGNATASIKYTYVKDIYLTGDASYLAANTLAFADLNTLYKGQSGVALFTTGNNTQPITITANPASAVTVTGNTAAATIAGNTIGKVTITATQLADLTNDIAGTSITKTITITEPVVWNWGDLYFGTVNEKPVTILNGATSWTLEEKEDKKNIINFQGSSPNYTASIADQIAGKYEVTFTYSDNKGVTKDFVSTIYTNPRHLRVDVNNDTVYRAVTLSANMQVNYHSNRKAVGFSSTAQNISQWKMTFLGVPDKIYFTPEGDNTWQIEESSNGTNWTTSMPWKYLTTNQPFEMSLLPSTSYLRVSYGAGDLDSAYLKELYITELTEVKADVKKLYMPIDGVNNAIKEVVLTYANTGLLSIRTTDPTNFQLKFSDSDATPTEVLSIPATTDENPFGIKGVDVVCKATVETSAELLVFNGSQLVLQIPIYAYLFPQELPIKLATDQPAGGDRYYFVTTHSHNAEWDGTDGVRTLTMNNAVSDAAPYVTFAFKGAPTFISFDYTSAAKGVWNIEESTDGKNFSNVTPATDDVMADGKFKRTVSNTSKYIKVIYESAYAEKVDLTDITIVGDASVVVNPTKLELDYNVAQQLTLTTVNLTAINIATSSANFKIAPTTTNGYEQTIELNSGTNPDQLGENKMGDIVFDVKWTGEQMVEYGTIVITNPNDGDAVLATVELTGIKNSITDGNINIHTGVPSGFTLKGSFEGTEHRRVDISAAFSTADKPLFDYVVVYGETTTNDGQSTISTPNSTNGSNAKTPFYIYKKSNDGNSYELYKSVENANSSTKAWYENGDDAVTPNGQNSVSMYITGFCPYATTGYTKDEEGVWYFRANAGQSIDVYLQDCYIYSRAKTIDGHTFADRSDGQSFVDHYSRGTGAVLVFACNDKLTTPMNVTIHTLDNNLLKSNYGCFLQSIAGRAFQASSPVQIRLIDDNYATASTTTLNFTDEWPASQHAKTGEGIRTNGFISLQKQVNNAPSIDMGNSNTVVNFDGGQVELQNAQIVSTNYASSLAICPRSGKFAGIFLAYGLGTDDVGGTVNFNDGTTTVQEMWVSPNYFESYLCEKDASGNYITNAKGEYLTTCLRTPTNTFIYGGSHCMMRACSDPQSQGGAPKDQPGGKLLGIYKYPKNPEAGKKGGWDVNGTNGLVTPTTGNVPNGYKVASVTPNTNGTDDVADDYLNFWFDPEFEPTVQPEKDKKISFWKTSMTRISAEYANYGERFVGGETSVEFDGTEQMEIVKNLLYCKIDENIRNVIIRDDFMAPVKNPAPEGDGFIPIHPTKIGSALNSEGAELENFITNGEQYQVENKVYYITTATADIWNAFTAPFDVANVYVMETYPEELLEEMEWKKGKSRGDILEFQAEHNAYFAGFFGVTIALGQDKNFKQIYQEYMQWANTQGYAYPVGGMRTLIPYNGTNWSTADFYLNENTADWTIDNLDDGNFTTAWQFPDATTDGILMHQGKTYSMLFPFCTGCGESIDDREYWDYWSGKFIIFESVDGTLEKPHKIYGSNHVGSLVSGLSSVGDGVAKLLGNSSFAEVTLSSAYPVLYYSGDLKHSTFYAMDDTPGVKPTESFLVANPVEPIGMQLVAISMDGKATYVGDPNNGTTTGSHTPTIGGGNSLFVTGIAGGINIAVAQPQFVQVISATGVVLYNGYVTDNVNVPLPINGIYVVKGENEAQKIFF